MYKNGTGNDKQRKDAENRMLGPYRNFAQAIITFCRLTSKHRNALSMFPGPSFTCTFWHVEYYKSCHKITVVFFYGIAKLAFSDENVGFNSGFFQMTSLNWHKATKIETDISNPNSKWTKWQEQQIIVSHVLILGPSSTMVLILSCVWMWPVRVTKQHSGTIHPS